MPTYTQYGEPLQEFTPTAQRIPISGAEDMPVITVQARFDWKFWGAIAVGALALYILTKSIKRTSRHG